MSEACPYCGNNPVPHGASWWGNSISTFLRPRRVDGGDSWYQIFAAYVTSYLIHYLFVLFRFLSFAKLIDDPALAPSERGRVLWEEAIRRGTPFFGLKLFGRHIDAYCMRVKGRELYFVGLPRPIYSESSSEWWLDDKAILKERLMLAGIPVPRGGGYTRFAAAARAFEALEKPVIVKPRVGSRGRHTTTHIHTLEELRRAFKIAKQLCFWVVVEEHLVGSVYRGTMIDGVLAGVLAGDPPRIVGDGVHTIEELVPIKNSLRHAKVSAVVLDDRHRAFLARTGRSFATVPALGETVDLLEKIGVSYGGHSAEVTGITHPAIKDTLERAARVVADPIIGFDFIIANVAGDPARQKWGIIECNSTPFINLHHDPVEGTPMNVAARLWDYVESHIERF
jgi:hypothetical protein